MRELDLYEKIVLVCLRKQREPITLESISWQTRISKDTCRNRIVNLKNLKLIEAVEIGKRVKWRIREPHRHCGMPTLKKT